MKKNIVKILCATVALSAIGISSVFASSAVRNESTKTEHSKAKKHDLTEVAELLSITAEELEEKLQNGENLYTLLESAGKLDEFKKLQIANFTEKLNQHVTDGKMTQDEANEKIAEFTEKINSADSADMFSKKGHKGDKDAGFRHEKNLTEVAELLSITTEELEEKLKNGENLYTLLENAGKLDEFKKLQIANFTEKLNQHVTDGKMTQDEANEKIAEFTEKINSADSADMFSKKAHKGGKGDKSDRSEPKTNVDAETKATTTA